VRNIKTEHKFLVGKTEDKEYYLRFQRRLNYNIKIDSKDMFERCRMYTCELRVNTSYALSGVR
jgi:hypothetical protein